MNQSSHPVATPQSAPKPPHFDLVPYETKYRNPEPPRTIFNVRETIFDDAGDVKEVSPWWIETIDWMPEDITAPVDHLTLIRVLSGRVVERIQQRGPGYGRRC